MRRKLHRRIVTLLLPFALVAPACAGPDRSEASPQQLRDMIDLCDQYMAAPEAVDPAAIIAFANASSEVQVVFGPGLEGIAIGEAVPRWASTLLLAGFVAGNVRAQLVAGRADDDPVAGYRGILAVYRVLQAKGLSMASIDELDAAEQEGRIEAWVAGRT